MTMSLSAEALALATRSLSTSVPRFSRIEVGMSSRISFANVLRREEGSRDVVTSGRGSTRPEVTAYSSSISISSVAPFAFESPVGSDSSYLKSSLSRLSFAIDGSRGFPEARDCFSFALRSAIEASLSCRALR
ncbi:hypothetical protein H113_00705 [Trichophyton rubrum MR1459]|uniref:Uncharacterized protein n=1 Tax=Trichophyton rubrum (strain ATCC MYA-4607 / CBS 118892) TaxID=559305 RepID=A0A080WR74_TRIRC|nr:uncharacterized protein TERG_12600 [Trichophyton rubrum CBS 118892]EZF99716.1 hypothetical protein H113_00705 [Trichophyton rubrum MR1459]KFL62845.1 hypothetical protein TERG_12600 [Trichophyton rubrum CBS 118892]